jgi:hypothetical protein
MDRAAGFTIVHADLVGSGNKVNIKTVLIASSSRSPDKIRIPRCRVGIQPEFQCRVAQCLERKRIRENSRVAGMELRAEIIDLTSTWDLGD